jgi:hypothetical protein
MAHLLSFWVVQSAARSLAIYRVRGDWGAVLGEVDFMIEEGGLRRRGRYYRNLYTVSIQHILFW